MENMSIEVMSTAIITSSSVKPPRGEVLLVWLRKNIESQSAGLLVTAIDPGKIERHGVEADDILLLLILPLKRRAALLQSHAGEGIFQLNGKRFVIERDGARFDLGHPILQEPARAGVLLFQDLGPHAVIDALAEREDGEREDGDGQH